jgi:hypothetical protein
MTCSELKDLIEKDLPISYYDLGPISNPKVRYYQALMSYCRLFRVKTAFDLGHFHGDSAWALGQYAAEVRSFDILPRENHAERHQVPLTSNTQFVLLEDPEEINDLPFEEADFMFVDLDHSGVTELLLHEAILKSNYQGFVFYDDILLFDMYDIFWQPIEDNPDMDSIRTEWHDNSHLGNAGFGIVKY